MLERIPMLWVIGAGALLFVVGIITSLTFFNGIFVIVPCLVAAAGLTLALAGTANYAAEISSTLVGRNIPHAETRAASSQIKRISAILVMISLVVGGEIIWRHITQPTPTELSRSVIYGDAHQVTELLDKGAEIDGLDSDGRTALMEACTDGKADIVKLLIARGADVDKRVSGNETPLLCGQSKPEIVSILRKAGAKDTGQIEGQ